MNSEALQKKHFNSIAVKYDEHYGDYWSLQYIENFINIPMFDGINLNGLLVIDALCGSGQTTDYLLKKGATVIGLDISEEQIKTYRQKWPTCRVNCASILATEMAENAFDCIAIVGGLHHLHPSLPNAVEEIYRILRPGGYFCFAEPHKGSLPDIARQIWYKYDASFADNEAAIDVVALKEQFTGKFNFIKEKYIGSLAYLFVYNSMIFRLPVSAKKKYAPILIKLEAILEKAQNSWVTCMVICQWQKKG